jgi:DNA-binding NarL/FixJ family response regulator
MKATAAYEDPCPQAVVVGAAGIQRDRARALLACAGWVARTADAIGVDALDAIGVDVIDGELLVLLTGVDAVRAVRRASAALPETRLLAVTPSPTTPALLRRVLVAGATGIVLEDDLETALAPSCRAAMAGQLVVPSMMVRQIAPRPLSHREREVLALLVEGCTNRQIADRLFLAESTIKTHLSSLFAKFDSHSRSEVVARILDPQDGGPLVFLPPGLVSVEPVAVAVEGPAPR